MSRERLSLLAAVPDDVTDPLLWRLALDVTAAHQPDNHGNCRNLQCAGQRGVCAAVRAARRAMHLARRGRLSATPPPPHPVQERDAVTARRPGAFRGWFAPSPIRPVAAALPRQPYAPFSLVAPAA